MDRYLDSLLLLPKFLVLVTIVPAAGFVIRASDVKLMLCSVLGIMLSNCCALCFVDVFSILINPFFPLKTTFKFKARLSFPSPSIIHIVRKCFSKIVTVSSLAY